MVLFAMPAVMLASTALISTGSSTRISSIRRRAAIRSLAAPFLVLRPPRGLHHLYSGDRLGLAMIPTFAPPANLRLPALVLSLVATAFIAFGLWVHHMFATGLPQLGESFFTAASMMMAMPSGIQIFCWLATLWTGRIVPDTAALRPRLYRDFCLAVDRCDACLGAPRPAGARHLFRGRALSLRADRRGGFSAFGGFYFWFPKITGRMLDETSGKWLFWLFFIGFNLTFFPMHLLSLAGILGESTPIPTGSAGTK